MRVLVQVEVAEKAGRDLTATHTYRVTRHDDMAHMVENKQKQIKRPQRSILRDVVRVLLGFTLYTSYKISRVVLVLYQSCERELFDHIAQAVERFRMRPARQHRAHYDVSCA